MCFKKLYVFFTVVLFVFVVTGCATSPYPSLITGVKPGGQNEWVAESISKSDANGTIYTQFVPLTQRLAAIITVGKINNMLVAQTIITSQTYAQISWAFIEMDNIRFDGQTSGGMTGPIYIKIKNPKQFIKILQQKKMYEAELMLDMNIYRCRINGNLELF